MQLGFYLLQNGTGLAIEVVGCLGKVCGVCLEGERAADALLFGVLLDGQGEGGAVMGGEGVAAVQGVSLHEHGLGVGLALVQEIQLELAAALQDLDGEDGFNVLCEIEPDLRVVSNGAVLVCNVRHVMGEAVVQHVHLLRRQLQYALCSQRFAGRLLRCD